MVSVQSVMSKEPGKWDQKLGGQGATQDVEQRLRMNPLNKVGSCGVAARLRVAWNLKMWAFIRVDAVPII